MPAKPRRLLAIPDAIAQLEQFDRALLTRRDIERLFGVGEGPRGHPSCRRARLTGVRFKVPAETMSAKLADLPEGVSVERGWIEVRFDGTEDAGGGGEIVRPGVIGDAGPQATASRTRGRGRRFVAEAATSCSSAGSAGPAVPRSEAVALRARPPRRRQSTRRLTVTAARGARGPRCCFVDWRVRRAMLL